MSMASAVIQQQDRDGMLRRALERIIQLYTDKSHFVYELLQNAEDSGAKNVKFVQYEDRLEVFHDGHPFTLANLQGLCDIGKSDKIHDLNQIGEFGVGFKSVFGICETVELHSAPQNYRGERREDYRQFSVIIKDFTKPEDIPPRALPFMYTTLFVFPYSIGHTFSGFDSVPKLIDTLSQRLQNLGITTLLFMKNLESIEYQIELDGTMTTGNYLLDKQVVNDHCEIVSAMGERNQEEESTSYLVFSRPVNSLQSNRTVDIAFPVNIHENGEYEFKKTKYPYISVYFPTETESKLDFIVQGPYRTTPNRSSVPADDADNMELAQQTAALLFDSILEIKSMGKLSLSLLEILPIDEGRFAANNLFHPLFKKVKQLMYNKAVLPCKNGGFESSSSVKLARGQKLADLFDDTLLTELLNSNRSLHWLPTELTATSPKHKAFFNFLLNELGIEEIRPEDLQRYFTANTEFISKRDNDWLADFYAWCESTPALFAKTRHNSSTLLTVPIVRTSKGTIVAPFLKVGAGDYKANVFLPIEEDDPDADVNFVNNKLYKRCRHFFTNILQLQAPNEYEFWIKGVRRRYHNISPLTDEQHHKDIQMLLRYIDYPNRRDEINGIIKTVFRLRCTGKTGSVWGSPARDAIIFPIADNGIDLRIYYRNIATKVYLDTDYYESIGIPVEKLKVFGVSDTILLGSDVTHGDYESGKPGRDPEWRTHGDFRWCLSIDKLSEVLNYIQQNPSSQDALIKSKAIFTILQENAHRLKGTVFVGGSSPNVSPAYAEMVKALGGLSDNHGISYISNAFDSARYSMAPLRRGYSSIGKTRIPKWLFTESMTLVSPQEISKNDLNSAIYGRVNPNSEFYEILGFRKSEEDRYEEHIKEYSQLPEEKKKAFFEMELQRRFGISSSDLEKTYSSGAGTGPTPSHGDYDFPTSTVRNWASLKKHAAEMLCYANPVKYEYKIRHIRSSKSSHDTREYLLGMYKIDGIHRYACQMCHDTHLQVEHCQIDAKPELELDPMNVCLCSNCANTFRALRNRPEAISTFISRIHSLTEDAIGNESPVKIPFENHSIWFTQTHIAEITELWKLQRQVEHANNTKHAPAAPASAPTPEKPKDSVPEAKKPHPYQELLGKNVRFRATKDEGTITMIQSAGGYDFVHILFTNGNDAGKTKPFDLQKCVSNRLFEVL